MTGIIKASDLIDEVWDARKRALDNLATELFRCGIYLALSPEFLPIETRFPPSGDELFGGILNVRKSLTFSPQTDKPCLSVFENPLKILGLHRNYTHIKLVCVKYIIFSQI